MKMKPEHFEALRAAVAPLDTPTNRTLYINNGFPRAAECKDKNMRYRWDLLYASKLKIGDGVGMSGLPLYQYLDSTHIDTALRAIVPPL